MTNNHFYNARRLALGLVMADLDLDRSAARALLEPLDPAELAMVAMSLAAFAVEIVAPSERMEFRAEVADEALAFAQLADRPPDPPSAPA